MHHEVHISGLLFLATTGAVCLTVALDALGRKGGLVGMRLALTVAAVSSTLGTFSLIGAALENDLMHVARWHALLRAGVGLIGGAAAGGAWVLVRPRNPRPVPAIIFGVGGVLAGIGAGLSLRCPPDQFIQTAISWFPLALSLRIYDAGVVVASSLMMFGAAIWRLASGARYGRSQMVLLVVMQSLAAVGYGFARVLAPPTLMQAFGIALTASSAVIFWAVLRTWRVAGVDDSAFALLFRSTPVPIVALDLHTDAVMLNPPAEALLGSKESIESVLARLGMSGTPEVILRTNAGKRLDQVKLEGAPDRVFELQVHFDGSREIGLLVMMDVTERVDHARELSRSLNDLQTLQERLVMNEKMAAIGVLVAGVNHEINNPLAYASANLRAVRDSVEALLAGVPLARRIEAPVGVERTALREWAHSPRVREAEVDALAALDEAAEGCARIQETVSSLRMLSRQDETEHMADLAEIGRAGLKIGRTNLQPGIEVISDLEQPLPIKGVSSELSRVVTNLVVNAGQAMGGSGRLSVRGFEEDGAAVIEVCDDGPGVPPNLRARIFEPFFTTKAPGQGTGLGLAISYETSRRHRGELRLVDGREKGACFQLRVPLMVAAENEPALRLRRSNRPAA